MARQWLDVFSPANSPWTNPEVLRRTRAEAGMNLARGLCHGWTMSAHADKRRDPAGEFVVGKDVAVTPATSSAATSSWS